MNRILPPEEIAVGLDTVEIVMAREQKFGIDISDADAAQCGRVGALHRCVMRLLEERYRREGRNLMVDPEITWDILVSIVVEESGVPPSRVQPKAEWGRDLGID